MATFTTRGIVYTGCTYTYGDGHDYYCKTSSGTVITDKDTLYNNWSTAKRYITFKLDGETYTDGQYTWYVTSSGTGGSGPVQVDTTYYVTFIDPGADYPISISTLSTNGTATTGWISNTVFLKGCTHQLRLRYYPNGGTANNSSYPLNSSGYYNGNYTTNLINVGNIFDPPTGYSAVGGTKAYRVGGPNKTTYASHASGEFTTTKSYNGSNQHIKLYANWTPIEYKITLNKNGGSGGTSATWLLYNTQWQNSDDEAITQIGSAPTLTGYTFAGYYTSASGGTKIINANLTFVSGKLTFTTEATTLYAQWTPNVATIHYYANNGTAKDGYALDSSKRATNSSGTLITTSINYDTPKNVYDVSTLFSPPTGYHTPVSSTDYYDTGWRVGSGTSTTYATQHTYNANSHITAGNATIKFYARWLNNTYTVSYNGNGNTGGSTSSSSHTYDVAKALTSNGFTRSYTVTYNANGGSCSTTSNTATYTFKNWNKNAAGTSTSYTNKQSVSNLTSTNGGTVILYAQWNSASVILPTPTRTGYTFNGWYTATSEGTKVGSAGDSYTPTAAITLYAQWTINTHNLIYQTNATDSDSAVNNMPSDVSGINYGTSYTISSTLPLKFPYQFEDWYCVEDTTYYDPNTSIIIDSDKTLYPYWRNPVELTSKSIDNTLYIWNGGGEGYYKFIPSETATYVVYSTTHGTDSKDVKSYLFDNLENQLTSNDDHGKTLNNQIGNWDFLISYPLTAGQAYYYKTQFYGSTNTGNISVNCGPTYIIQYIDELGLATMPANEIKYYGLYCYLTSTIPSRGDNWEFTGWKINDIDYTSGASFTDDDAGFYNSTLSEYVIEAKSQWQKYISLNFNTNGGSGSPSSSGTYIYNTTTNHTFTIGTTTPTKTHCKFLGWYLEGGDFNGITNFQPGDSITLNNSAILKAIWLNYGTSKIRYNSNFYNTIPYIYTNGEWKECMPFIYSDNQWYHPLSENTESYLTYNITNNNADGNYGFKLNSNGFYESQNKNINNSYALCTINLTINNSCKIYLDCINYGESNYDYGLISNLNSSLSASNTADTDYKKTFKGEQSAYVQTVSYGTLSPGFYTIMIKFRKDGSVNSNNDSLQFRLRYE